MAVTSPFAALLAALPVSTDVVSVLGSDTHYWTYGPDDAATTVVVVHGYRGEHHGLEPVIAQLRGLRIVSPDLPGFGESGPMTAAPHSIEGYGRWLAGFLAELGLEHAVVLGHSFGSIVTSHAVAAGVVNPPRLILVNPIAAPATSGPNAAMTRVTVAFYGLSKRLPERIGNWLLGHWIVVRVMSVTMVQTKDRALRRWIHDQHHTYFSRFSDRATVVEGFIASISTHVGEVGASIAVPTLLIGAELDPITPVADLHALADTMPAATLHVIPGVGHLVHYEKSREAASFIVDFLGDGSLADTSRA